ncbi:MAG: hypothetical protein ACR2F6_05080, partial [Mycobacteriales bacterium]
GGLERMWRTSILPLLEEHHYGESVDVARRYSLEAIQQFLTAGSAPVTPDKSTGLPERDTASAAPDEGSNDSP